MEKIAGLYLAAFYGNDNDGPDGTDTVFLLRAKDHHCAARHIELEFGQKQRVCMWVCLLAVDQSVSVEEIVIGPLLGMASARVVKSVWTREEPGSELRKVR
jgi:hypothetical protein